MEILIVEDAADIRAYLKAMLVPLGWKVHEAADGNEACGILRQQAIKVVLTDWMMPGMDGIELIRWIRNHQSGDVFIENFLEFLNINHPFIIGSKLNNFISGIDN